MPTMFKSLIISYVIWLPYAIGMNWTIRSHWRWLRPKMQPVHLRRRPHLYKLPR